MLLFACVFLEGTWSWVAFPHVFHRGRGNPSRLSVRHFALLDRAKGPAPLHGSGAVAPDPGHQGKPSKDTKALALVLDQ